ncbi:diaminopimelate epimerase [Pseudalkalibacillus caeni]|uniref:Diaminopimelate epimerase n=1 Tax=Exobacillus caeni TaxID=2574798 RepID=A0A5R9FH18_9BACL|nr:diaminopimelate epimerase [Pseudalkalibacillus caeni]TLS38845.1 diaminopimelate epimerase [Pseudalkalibacillus caeni]
MKKIHFTKMHGLGNNYLYINMFEEKLEEDRLSNYAVEMSNVHTGVGSDGIILICPSEKAPVKMRIFNNDGSEAKNCGNGLRCVAKYAFENGLVSEESFKIETLAGIVQASVFQNDGIVHSVTVDMGEPGVLRRDLPMAGEQESRVVNEEITVLGKTYSFTAVSMGNPHGVFFVDDIGTAPLKELGPALNNDERFPEGLNVEFVEKVSRQEFHFRVWERGTGITQACGTGACAAVVAAALNNLADRNEEVTVHLAGGDLIINWTNEGKVLMTGPAEVICNGVYFVK